MISVALAAHSSAQIPNDIQKKNLNIENPNKIMNGPYWQYHDNGQKQAEGRYLNGQLEGKWVWWYENGQKQEEVDYMYGKPKGEGLAWYPDGRIRP